MKTVEEISKLLTIARAAGLDVSACDKLTPEEIANAVLYFASDESQFTTGQILEVCGGFGLATPVFGDLQDKSRAAA